MAPYYKIAVIAQVADIGADEADLKKAAAKVLELEGVGPGVEINILFTDDKNIQDLNKRFLNRDEPTDVIAFGAKRGRPRKENLKGFIGDVVISVETATYNAKRFNTTKEKEILLYVTHGILHLLGYADESGKQQRIMQARQERLLSEICAD